MGVVQHWQPGAMVRVCVPRSACHRCPCAGVETSDTAGVLDGGLGPFMEAYLKMRGRSETQQELGSYVAAA